MMDYKDEPFTVLAFPCNQFGGQEPWENKEISRYTEEELGRNFPIFAKIDVNGENTHPVYQALKIAWPGDITWNFASKFLVDKTGNAVKRWDRGGTWEEINVAIKEALIVPYEVVEEKSGPVEPEEKSEGTVEPAVEPAAVSEENPEQASQAVAQPGSSEKATAESAEQRKTATETSATEVATEPVAQT